VLDPDHVDSLVNRVDLLLERGETGRARADIDAGLELDPGNANLLSARGALLADSGDTDAAYASYTAAVGQDPAFVAAWANRAVLSYSVGRPADAVADLDHAIALADDPSLRVNRAIALQDLDEHRRAVADLDITIAALEGGDPDLLYRRGVSWHVLADFDGAFADWRAHLQACGHGSTSPHAEEIRLRCGDLMTGHLVASATSLASVSLEPPVVSFSIALRSSSWRTVESARLSWSTCSPTAWRTSRAASAGRTRRSSAGQRAGIVTHSACPCSMMSWPGCCSR
jgi:hypothetical protein